MEGQGNIIDSKENVARLLSNEWLVEGEVSVDAFALAPKGVSSDDILMEVQWCLKDIAKQATFELSLPQEQE